MKSQKKKILSAIKQEGCLLVYPITNQKQPKSFWSVLYPKAKMRWEWDTDGDNRVVQLWYLREELSRSDQVVYSKWFKGRATFFSRPIFTALLAYLKTTQENFSLPRSSKEVLELLDLESPQSTKQIKAALEWQGRLMESHYNRAMKPLWENLFLIGYGEVHDSSFPSLNVAASHTLLEDLWVEARNLKPEKAYAILEQALGKESLFLSWAQKIRQKYE